MTTELSFLLDLLLNQRMPLATKELVVARIKEVEANLDMRSPMPARSVAAPLPAHVAMQAPSTQALMLKHGVAIDVPSAPHVPPPTPEAVTIVAHTPAAAAAMASRDAAISASMMGKVDKTTGRPRKF